MEGRGYIIYVVIFLTGLIPTLISLWLNERVKGSVKSFFDSKLEVLKKEHSKEISQFQSEINYLKSKENFKFTKLHEERLIVLAQTYQYINENLLLLKKCTSALKDEPGENFASVEEQVFKMEYLNAYRKFLEYFGAKAIYFDEDIENLIADFFEVAAGVYLDHNYKQSEIDAGAFPKEEINFVALESYNAITVKLAPIKKQIEIKFRELLG